MTAFATQFGEAFEGEGAEAAHLNTVLGARGGPVEGAWVGALARPSPGHVAFVAVLRPGLPVLPFTLFVNKATLAGKRHARLTWGPAQAGVARGVADAVADGVIPAARVGELLLVAAVWVDPAARDARAVFRNNARATRAALEAGARGEPRVEAVLAARVEPTNPYYPAAPARPSGPRRARRKR